VLKNILAATEDCNALFALMNRVRDLTPWEWMEETEPFGVQHPATGEIGFVSVMGNGGEYYAISATRPRVDECSRAAPACQTQSGARLLHVRGNDRKGGRAPLLPLRAADARYHPRFHQEFEDYMGH
jgi:hypothetical protein